MPLECQVEGSKCQEACSKCFSTGAQYLSGRVGGWVGGWMGGWVALEEWKVRLTQPPAGVSLAGAGAEPGNI